MKSRQFSLQREPVILKVRGDEMTKLTKVGTPVHLKVTVPQTLCKEGRTLYALRCHEGKAALGA